MTDDQIPFGPVEAEASRLGFSLFGVTDARRSDHAAFLRGWLDAGHHGEMGWMARSESVARRADLRLTLENVRSVIVVGHEYGDPDPGDSSPGPDRGIIARYARGRDYHRVIPKRLRKLGQSVERLANRPLAARGYTDTGPLLERELAQRAGIGWFGRNTMLINPRRGSYFFLAALLIDVAIETTQEFSRDHCGSCNACLVACPTGALLGRDGDGAPVMDARRCISYLTIESRGPIPEQLRAAIGNRVFGCDICQEVCPFNKRFAVPPVEAAYASRAPRPTHGGALTAPSPPPLHPPSHRHDGGDSAQTQTERFVPGTSMPSLVDLIEMSPKDWDRFSEGSPIRRAGYEGFRRNVAVALGNWGSEEARHALRAQADDPSPLVREHVEWALDQIATPRGVRP